MATTGTKVPSVFKIPSKLTPELKQFAESIKEAVEVRLGRRGDPKDRAVTLRELIDSGLAKDLLDNPFDPNAGVGVTDFAPITFTSSTIPPTPTGLSASGAFTNIILAWDNPQYNGLAYTEIWRNTSDDVGTATRVDTTRAIVWTDTVDPGETYFYWVRHVSTSDRLGVFSPSVTATTAKVDASIIEDAVITGQKLVDGAVTAVKIAEDAVTTAKIATNAITATEIADDSITTAKILANNVTASEIAAGTVTSTQIAAGTIAASNMAAGSITAGNAALADASILRAKIVNGEIIRAKIADLAVDNAKIADATIAHGKIASLDAAVINTNSLNIAGAAIDGFMGAMFATQGIYTMSETNWSALQAGITSYEDPESITTPIRLDIPPTATAEAKTFLIRLQLLPRGVITTSGATPADPLGGGGFIRSLWTSIDALIGYATTGTGLSWNSSPFFAGSPLALTSFANIYLQDVQAEALSIAHQFSITTSTSETLTYYIWGFAGLYGVYLPGVEYTLSVEGLFR